MFGKLTEIPIDKELIMYFRLDHRTITKTMLERLQAQAEEAKLLGLRKVASNLEKQVGVYSTNIRDNDSSYVYSSEQMQEDVQNALWNTFIRVADFYGANIDATKAQQAIEKIAEDLVEEVRVNTGILDGVGAYEPSTPGEHRENVTIEVE